MRRRDAFGLMLGALGSGAVNRGAQAAPQSPASGPDLGNLHNLLAGISGNQNRELSFLAERWKRLEDWKLAARKRFVELLSYDPEPLPLAARSESVEERDGLRIERLAITATARYEIPACLLMPVDRRGKLPGIVAIHCHSGRYVWGIEKIVSSKDDSAALAEFRERAYGRPYAEVLAKRGVVVLVIDGFYFGSRRLRVEEMDPASAPPAFRERLQALAGLERGAPDWLNAVNRLCGEFEHLTAKTIFSAGATWPGLLVWDDRRSVDYLVSRPEVDARRIGCLGLSIGGLRTAHLIAADARLKTACVTGWMTVFHEQLRNHLRSHTWMAYVPGLYGAMDLPDAAALHAPGALLVQQCSRDSLYPMAGMRGAVEKLERIYRKAGLPERFRGAFHDVPHMFTPAMQEEAFAWLERWI